MSSSCFHQISKQIICVIKLVTTALDHCSGVKSTTIPPEMEMTRTLNTVLELLYLVQF